MEPASSLESGDDLPRPPAESGAWGTCDMATDGVDASSARKATARRWARLWQRWDVTFVCEDGARVRGNRGALAAASRYFDCLLSSGWREASQAEVPLPTVDAHVLEHYVFEHLRTGAVPKVAARDSLPVVMEAYELARQYGMRRLELQLLREVVAKMDITSSRWLLRRALDLGAQELVTASIDFLSRVWSRGATGVAIEGASQDAVVQYLQSPMLLQGPVEEEHVLQAIVEWGKEQLGLDDGVWRGETSVEERQQLAVVLEPLLPFVRLADIPAPVLEAKVEPLGLFTQQQMCEVYRQQAKMATPVPSEMHTRSFWDSASMPSGVSLLDQATVLFAGMRGHKGACGKLGLTRGRWTWRLRVERTGRKYAWAGVVDATVDLALFPGSQPGGFLFGSGGFLRSKASAAAALDSYGAEWHRDGAEVDVHLDMDARTCAFSLDGRFLGPAYTDLPPCVFPAASMSGGGVLRFVRIDVGGPPKPSLP